MLSQTAEYALRAVLYLAEKAGDGPVRVEDVAEALSVPRNYLSKILHVLARGGILASTRGPHGGFELAVPANRLVLADVVGAFDELEGRGTCLLGRTSCSDRAPCAAHHRWKEVSDTVRSFFRHTTVAELFEQGAEAPTG
ncbi:MAG TPA: Rrf2 family transcriptional regulator [Candidatus Thermoplasmatota archaeon]